MSDSLEVTFQAIAEDQPGEKWQACYERSSPKWREWYLRNGPDGLPTVIECRQALSRHMPKWRAIHDRMCAIVNNDEVSARLLSGWNPPPLFSGCSVLALSDPEPVLIRSYDFTPRFFDAIIGKTSFCGRQVIAMCEGASGCLDGVNEDGLAAALTFGGRLAHGSGFAIPLIVRYVLETCAATEEAVRLLRDLPSAGVQNVMLLDRHGDHAVVYLRPDRPAEALRKPAVTNHQERVEWDGAHNIRTVERHQCLLELREAHAGDPDAAISAFLKPPLYHTDFENWFGTLYTAAYYPARGEVRYLWRNDEWRQSFEAFQEGVRVKRWELDGVAA